MIKLLILFLLFMNISLNLIGADRCFIAEKNYENKIDRIWSTLDEIEKFKKDIGYAPINFNNGLKFKVNQPFSDVYKIVPLDTEIISDSTCSCIFHMANICNGIGIAVWTPTESHMLYCFPQEIYMNQEGEIVIGKRFCALKVILQKIPQAKKAETKIYLVSSMFTDLFTIIQNQIVALGYTISGMSVPDIIQVKRENVINYYVKFPKLHLTGAEASDKIFQPTTMFMDTKDGSILVQHLALQ